MARKLIQIAVCVAVFAVSAAAQTNVTNSNNGTANTVPVYTGKATLGNSPITASSGKVGIGTTSPGYTLDVEGGQVNASGGFCIAKSCITLWPTASANTWTGAQKFQGTTNFPSGVWNTNGNVGIGTATPQGRLHVDNGDAQGLPTLSTTYSAIFQQNTAPGWWNAIGIIAGSGGLSQLNFGDYTSDANGQIEVVNSGTSSEMALYSKGAFSFNPGGVAWGRKLVIGTGGVGIGTGSPAYQLDVQGGQVNASGGYCIGGSCITSWPTASTNTWTGTQTFQGTTIFPLSGAWNTGGYVGIGTTTPTAALDIENGPLYGNALISSIYAGTPGVFTDRGDSGTYSSTTLTGNTVNIGSYASSGTGTVGIFYSSTYSNPNMGWMYNIPGVGIYSGHTGNGSIGPIMFLIDRGDGAGVEKMRIMPSGNVGIGTTTPGYALDVNGQVHASGGITLSGGSGASITFQDGTTQSTAYTGSITCGGDYAESMDVTGERTKYAPGDVLVLDADHPGKILKSLEPYSTAVAGIYSTKPGTVGRRQLTPKNPDEIPMAMLGVVPAKVTAENGPIHVGDLLVSSSQPGYAMKGTDRSRMLGAVIGKAMGSLDSGAGTIEVLVALQ
ncbi:MAG: hypothetical protein WAO35_28350 [Terriglobia bacterium]